MPLYSYRNPKTGKIVHIVQGMNDEHTYSEKGVRFERVFYVPQAAVDTSIDEFNSKDFVEKTGKKKGSLNDLWNTSKELSEKRISRTGRDEVKEKYFKEYSKTRREGIEHPEARKEKLRSELKNNKVIDIEL